MDTRISTDTDVIVDETSAVAAEPGVTSKSDIDTPGLCETTVADDIHDVGTDDSGQLPQTTVDDVCSSSNLCSGEHERHGKQEAMKLKSKTKQRKMSPKSADTSGSCTKKPVVNYFVAVQISNTKIKDALQKVQEALISKDKRLSGAVTNVSKLHITLMVLSLETEEDMRRSQIAIDNAAQRLLPLHSVSPLRLDISGLGHFKHQVVFAKVKGGNQQESLSNIASVVEESFLDQQVISPDKRGFKPHATIMKMSQMKGWQKKGLKKIDEALYEEFQDCDFGSDTVYSLQICAMGKPKDKHGYYQVEHSALFGKPFTEEVASETIGTSNVDTDIVDTAVVTEVDSLSCEILCQETNAERDSDVDKNKSSVQNKPTGTE